MSTERT